MSNFEQVGQKLSSQFDQWHALSGASYWHFAVVHPIFYCWCWMIRVAVNLFLSGVRRLNQATFQGLIGLPGPSWQQVEDGRTYCEKE